MKSIAISRRYRTIHSHVYARDSKNGATTWEAAWGVCLLSGARTKRSIMDRGLEKAGFPRTDPARYCTAARCGGRSACGTAGRTIGRVTQLSRNFSSFNQAVGFALVRGSTTPRKKAKRRRKGGKTSTWESTSERAPARSPAPPLLPPPPDGVDAMR
jgi:hypothetical protein